MEEQSMNALEIEEKWKKKWAETGLYKFDPSRPEDKFYVLEMFSYPSGANLHVGHWYNYGPTDTFARFKRLQGYNVFHPMGFDAFGLPAENYAIRTGIHPQDSTLKNIETMEGQLQRIGGTWDWDYELVTCDPHYYKWTQWIFLQLYKNGLAYRKEAPVNWCPSCNTVLANEQVIDGLCERCSSEVVRKNLTQWFFKITDYAEELLQDLDTLDWPEKTKAMQRNWIGKSVGGEVVFELEDPKLSEEERRISVFTTRADTLHGCTYVVFSPEHPLVNKIVTEDQRAALEAYQDEASKSSEIDRLSTSREKTGVFTGAYAVNPINGRRVPVYAADYVLASYGTGIVMAVPAHDERDFAFAEKYDLPIERVIRSAGGEEDELPYCEHGILINSGEDDGLTTEEAKKAILSRLEKENRGGFQINYRLRDWLISRQRYWGAPIPIVYCPEHGEVPVPEDQLPVVLPYDVDFTPDGQSPLRKSDAFANTTCPICGKPAKRDVDTMDTFVCSSWYFLRYPNVGNDKEAFDRAWTDKILPVDTYVGGAEHAVMHLLYARFFVKALRDLKLLDFDEPFQRLIHQGTILGPDGRKMSKNFGNVVNPDDYVSVYGSDVFRMYLEFGFSYIEGGAWSDDGIKSIARFLDRVERLVDIAEKNAGTKTGNESANKALNLVLHSSIKSITQDVERFSFNTAIARLMELINAMYKYVDDGAIDGAFLLDVTKSLLILLSPFAPHRAEELWERIGGAYSIFNQSWPEVDPKALVLDEIEYAIQVNGKIRTRLVLPTKLSQEAAMEAAMGDIAVAQQMEGKQVVKVIVTKNLVNIVVK